MTCRQLIDYIKEVKPSAYSDAILLSWINDLEIEIQSKVWLLDSASVKLHAVDTEEILADIAHSQMYKAYLTAIIDLTNGEYSKYQNSLEVFNELFAEYKRWYMRRFHPADGKAADSGYYISAYSLAVKYGFSGTEEQWITATEAARVAAEAAQAASETARDAAASSKTAAVNSESAALNSANTAAAQAQAAAQSAGNAAAEASTAANKAQQAADSAAQAASKEASAGTAATNAATAKAAAEAAQQAAVTAKAAAETAKAAAEAANTAAQNAKTGAVSAKDAAVTAKTAAEAAQGLAETANTAAQGAATAANSAKTAAEAAASAATQKATAAANSADESEAWAAGTIGGVAVSSTHPAYQNNAKWYKDRAAAIVGGDYPTKGEAQDYATTAKNEAIAAAAADATTKANAAKTYADQQIAAIPPTDISNKLDKTGDGKDVVVTFTEAANYASPTSGDSVGVVVGKLAKLFTDLKTAAFRAATDFAAAVHRHVWGDIDDKPTTFPPSTHQHGTGDITSGTLPIVRGGTGGTTAAAARTNIGAAQKLSGTATLAVANWTGTAAPYTYTLAVSGMLATDVPTIDYVGGTDQAAAELIKTAWQLAAGSYTKPQTAAGQLIFKAKEKPVTNIPIYWEVMR